MGSEEYVWIGFERTLSNGKCTEMTCNEEVLWIVVRQLLRALSS